MSKNKTNLILLISSIVMLGSLATLIFFFKIIENKNKHTSATLVTLANKIVKKENSKALKDQIDEVALIRESTNKHFVNGGEMDSFIDYLEGLGKDAGTEVRIEDFKVSPDDKNTLSVKLSSKGSFNNVMKFLSIIENTQYQVYINKMILGKQPDVSNIDPKTGQPIPSGNSIWEADISFNILIS